MILSFWRRVHLILALLSCLFLLITSITGVILAFEPIQNQLSECHISEAAGHSLADLIVQLEKEYDEVFEIKIEENEFLQVAAITKEGEFESFYADPKTGLKIADIEERSWLFTFSRTLHRSLFLGDSGRLIIGITAFLLLLIAISGTVLIIRRQLGVKHFFSRIKRENFYQYSHVWLGRLSLVIILIISLTGSYLSMGRFGLLPQKQEIKHKVKDELLTEMPSFSKKEFAIFKSTALSEIQSVQFPFSPDKEDYFQLKLADQKINVNQFNGQIISSQAIDEFTLWEQFNYNLHTGKGSLLWSIVLCLASLSILFFIFSGFKITLKRLKGIKKNSFKANKSSIVILVGSQGGATFKFAKEFQHQLIQCGQKVFVDDLSSYEKYNRMEHLIILTSTYGNGEAPINSKEFIDRFNQIQQKKAFRYSIVGFGSTDYLQFCQFAKEISAEMYQSDACEEFISLKLINQQSRPEFEKWCLEWTKNAGIDPLDTAQTKN